MAKVAVVLSGCGVYDGSEIHESVIALLALDRAGADIVIAAPDVDQAHVVNHLTGNSGEEKRNVAVEAARIARGKVADLSEIRADDIDAVIFPGGFGAAKNLCTYAFDGADFKVNPDVERLTLEMARQKKPIGTICISPVVTAKILASQGIDVKVTIGTDEKTASDIESFGAKHQDCPVGDIVVDEENKVVSTPAYMLAGSIKEAAEGIDKLVQAVLELCE